MLIARTVLLAKLETQYGADASPQPSANAIVARNVELEVVGEPLKRDFLRDSLSPQEFVRGMKHVELRFETELKGSGTRGALPPWGWEGVLFQACGMSETITPGSSIVYEPASIGHKSCTIDLYKHRIFHKILGCRGDYRLIAEAGEFLRVAWRFQGLYVGPADRDLPSPIVLSDVVPPALLSAGGRIGDYFPAFTRFELGPGNDLSVHTDLSSSTGVGEVRIRRRASFASIELEAVSEATKSFWAEWAAGTAQAFHVGPVGSTAGNILEVDAPRAQIGEIKYADRDGLLTYEILMNLAMTGGNDELKITIS